MKRSTKVKSILTWNQVSIWPITYFEIKLSLQVLTVNTSSWSYSSLHCANKVISAWPPVDFVKCMKLTKLINRDLKIRIHHSPVQIHFLLTSRNGKGTRWMITNIHHYHNWEIIKSSVIKLRGNMFAYSRLKQCILKL